MNDFSYKKLIVWQKGMQLVREVYLITEKLPKAEEFNLKSQMRRAAVSIVSNIAEGSGRKSALERKRFYEVARSSLIEVDAQLEVCVMTYHVNEKDCAPLNNFLMEAFRMLTKMIEG